MRRRLPLIVLVFVLWMLLVWPFHAAWPVAWPEVLAGVLAALLLCAGLMRDVGSRAPLRWLDPRRIGWAVIYGVVLAWYVERANLDVVYRVLHPEMPIEPGIVRVKTALRSPAAITTLANSITLTPGTLTVNALPDGTLYIHWIVVRAHDDEEAAARIIRRFERILMKIFE